MKLLLQRVRQAGASNSRGALFIIFATIFVLGTLLPPAASKEGFKDQPPGVVASSPSRKIPSSTDYVVTTSSGASIVPGTTDTGIHYDDGTTSISLPFPVAFYDQVFTGANLSPNG